MQIATTSVITAIFRIVDQYPAAVHLLMHIPFDCSPHYETVKRQIIRTAESTTKILISQLHSRRRHFPASIRIIERTVDRRQRAIEASAIGGVCRRSPASASLRDSTAVTWFNAASQVARSTACVSRRANSRNPRINSDRATSHHDRRRRRRGGLHRENSLGSRRVTA